MISITNFVRDERQCVVCAGVATLHADADDSGHGYRATRANEATDCTTDSYDDHDWPGVCY